VAAGPPGSGVGHEDGRQVGGALGGNGGGLGQQSQCREGGVQLLVDL
jgi:hypothetical protein